MRNIDKKIYESYLIAVMLCGLFYWPTNFDVEMKKIPFYLVSWIMIIGSISAYGITYWELNWKRILLNGCIVLTGVAVIKIIIDYLFLGRTHDFVLLELMIVVITGFAISGFGIIIGTLVKKSGEHTLK